MMINKNIMKVLVLLLALTFISTPVFAKSTEKQSTSWWRIPYYHMLKVAKNIEKQIAMLDRKANKLEKKKTKLEEKLNIIENEIDSIEGRQQVLNSINATSTDGESADKSSRIICPGCYFSESEEFDGYDFSKAFLNKAYFNDALLNRTNFSGAVLKNAYFIRAELNEANFSGANLTNANLSGANLAGANLDGADLTNVKWFDQYYGDAVCPDNTLASEHEDTKCTTPLLSSNP